jgi:hypothetical protein
MHPTAQLRPPFAVALAVAAFVCSYAASDLWRMYMKGPPERVTQVLALALVWLPVALVAVGTYRGRPWGRWLVLGLTVFGLVYLPWSLPAAETHSMWLLQVLQAALHTLASALLLLPPARLWFSKANPKAAASVANQPDVA